MKLRRVMAAAATTAVISPLALQSAPAAFATDPTPTGTESASTTPSPTPSTTETTTPSPTPTTTPPSTEIPSGTPTPSTTPPTGSPTTTPGPSEEPDPDVPYCEDLDENYGDAKVSADIKGLPGKIVAGDGFHNFNLVVTNESKADLKGVAFYAEIENYELDEAKFLSPYVTLEFKNTESGKWERIGDENWAGDYFFYVESLKAKASEKVALRFSVDKGAPAGDSYSFGSGAYLDKIKDQDCIAEGWAQYDFEVLKAGSTNTDPGTADPSDNGKDPVKKPQGNVSELPTGNLAETGSSSALPTIGLVGGAAVVAGAGAVFVVRRRKAGADV